MVSSLFDRMHRSLSRSRSFSLRATCSLLTWPSRSSTQRNFSSMELCRQHRGWKNNDTAAGFLLKFILALKCIILCEQTVGERTKVNARAHSLYINSIISSWDKNWRPHLQSSVSFFDALFQFFQQSISCFWTSCWLQHFRVLLQM